MSDPSGVIAARLAELWRKTLPITLERVAALQAACEALGRNPADSQARSAGREAAHKLSGSLGIFGLPRGTELAAKLEEILKSTDPLSRQATMAMGGLIEDLEAVIASKQM
jgi:HPt (histidine-containing phosphotransfer) domain-containing protein